MKVRNIFPFAVAALFLALFALFGPDRPASDSPMQPPVQTAAVPAAPRLAPTVPRAETDSAITEFDTWLESYQAKPDQNFDIASVRPLAEARGEAMAELIRQYPEAALANALSWSEWLALPEEIQTLVEQPFSLRGDYSVYSGCGGNEGRHRHWLQTGDEQLRVFPTGAWRDVIAKYDLPVQGIRVGIDATLRRGVVQVLSAVDRQAVAEVFPLRHEGGQPVALLGGELLAANESETRKLADQLEQALGMGGPRTVEAGLAVAFSSGASNGGGVIGAASQASNDWSATPKSVIVLRCDFSDLTGAAQPQSTIAGFLSTCSDWVADSSYGRSSLTNRTVTSQVLRLPRSASQYGNLSNTSGQLATDARAAAANAGIAIDDFDIVVYSYKTTDSVTAGFASVGARDQWEGNTNVQTYMHEFGHNFGLSHANFWVRHQAGGDWDEIRGVNGSFGAAGNDEYGDAFDMMAVHFRQRPGSESVWPNGDFSMCSKRILGWIDDSRVKQVSTTGTYRVYRFDHPDTEAGLDVGLTFLTGQGKRIWAGLRRNFPSNHTLSAGAYMVWQHRDRNHRQIDCTPFSQIDGIDGNNFDFSDFDRDDSALAQGASWTSPDGSVRVTNTGLGGTAPNEFLDLRVEFLQPNAPHVVLSTDPDGEIPGLTGSYFNGRLISLGGTDWTTSNTPAGTRTDSNLTFRNRDWGDRAAMGITGGTDSDWSNVSVQWDGFLHVPHGVVSQTLSANSIGDARIWVDLNGDNVFQTGERLVDHNYGSPDWAQSEVSAPIQTGTYRVRVQYQDTTLFSDNRLVLQFGDQGGKDIGDFELYQDAALQTGGLTASFVNSSLRTTSSHADWRTSQTISGTRTEAMPLYWDNGMGDASTMGISTPTGSTSWINYSVQYDGWIKVLRRTRFLTYGADGSRFWIDTDGDGSFGSSLPEFQAGNWGSGGDSRYSPISDWINPGTYRIRIQHEQDNDGANRWAFMGQPEESFEVGAALQLPGSNSIYAAAPAGTPIAGNFTVEAWLKPDTGQLQPFLNTSGALASFGTTLNLWVSGPVAQFGDGTQWIQPSAHVGHTIRPGEWVHVAYSVSPSEYKVYLNGYFAGSGSLSGPVLLTDSSHTINIGQGFDGLIDEVRIWNTTRTGEQIASTMRRPINPASFGLSSYWRMDGVDSSGLLKDLSGSLDAFRVGDPYVIEAPSPIAGDDYSDSLNTPGVLFDDIGELRWGAIELGSDQDWFAIDVQQSGTLEIWTTGTLDTLGRLHDTNGTLLPPLNDDGGGVFGRNFRIIRELTPGRYYISVESYLSATGDYLLHSNFHPGGLPLDFDDPVLAPGDPIIPVGTSSNSPTGEQAANVIDRRFDTKYLNFGREDTGFIVTPTVGPQAVRGIVMVTANDEEGRDPVDWELFGCNDLILSTPDSLGDAEDWTPVANGTLAQPAARETIGQMAVFANTTSYRSYKFIVKSVKGGATANSMQIAEVQFITSSDLPTTEVSTLADSGAGSLREVISDLPIGASVSFASALSGGVLHFDSGSISINKPVILDTSTLADGMTFQGNGASRLFRVQPDASLSLKGVILTGGRTLNSNWGGAILSEGDLTIEDSALFGNVADGSGGAICCYSEGTLTLRNVTLAHNHCGAFGGAVRLLNAANEGLIENCTFSENSADTDGGGLSSAGTLILRDTIISGNRSGGGAQNFHKPGIETLEGTNLIDVDAKLGALGFYGGPTPIMPPANGSPAIDRATGSSIPLADQNGYARIAAADVGATESRPVKALSFAPEAGFDPADPHYIFGATTPVGATYMVESSEDLLTFTPRPASLFSSINPQTSWRIALATSSAFLRATQLPSLNDGLRAYWDFEGDAENAGYTLGDFQTGGRLHGTTVGDTSFADADILGNSAVFDGDGDYINIMGEIVEDAPDSSYSVSSWFILDSAPSGSARAFVYETSPFYAISLGLREGTSTGDTKLQFFTNIAGGDVAVVIEHELPDVEVSGKLIHSVVTYDTNTGTKTAYINGHQVGSTMVTGVVLDFDSFNIGTYRGADGRWFDGAIDEVAVWERPLSPAEIALLYNGGLPTRVTP